VVSYAVVLLSSAGYVLESGTELVMLVDDTAEAAAYAGLDVAEE
jgi:hypothetical protein